MEFIRLVMSLDWTTILITLGVALVLYNTYQIVRFTVVRIKARQEIKLIDAKIAGLHQELAEIQRSLADKIKKDFPR